MKYLLLVYLLCASTTGCFDLFEEGKNRLVEEKASPSGSKKATLFIKEGNATLQESLRIKVAKQSDKLEETEGGNAFVATYSLKDAVEMNWINDDTLHISFDKRLEIFKKELKINDVQIIYSEINPSKD